MFAADASDAAVDRYERFSAKLLVSSLSLAQRLAQDSREFLTSVSEFRDKRSFTLS